MRRGYEKIVKVSRGGEWNVGRKLERLRIRIKM
jgi:hypothetical protein